MSNSFTIEIQGLDEMARLLGTAPEMATRGIAKALYRRGLVIMERSQEIVPVGGPPTSPYDPAPGTLKGSGVVMMPEVSGSNVVMEMGYGGPAAAYVERQHEDLTFRHKPGQEAKFLERPLLEDVENITAAIAEALNEEGL